MTQPTCKHPHCHNPTQHKTLCNPHTTTLHTTLTNQHNLTNTLNTHTTHNKPQTTSPASRSAPTHASKILCDPRVMDAQTLLRDTYVPWAREIAGLPLPSSSVDVAAAVLLSRFSEIVQRPDAGAFCDEIFHAVAQGWAAVDIPPDLELVGECSTCGTMLYAQHGVLVIKCRYCDARIDVATARQALTRAMRHRSFTAADAARIMPWIHDKPVKRKTISEWRRRGKLIPVPGSSPPRYKLGDILDTAQT